MREEMEEMEDMTPPQFIGISSVIIVVLAILIGGCAYGCPQYKVYSERLEGEAELARATANRRIKIQEAEAKKESATLLADAEVERAKGVAKANKIIGDSLKGNEAYLRYLWIDAMAHDEKGERIYIPTEAGLPILEARK